MEITPDMREIYKFYTISNENKNSSTLRWMWWDPHHLIQVFIIQLSSDTIYFST